MKKQVSAILTAFSAACFALCVGIFLLRGQPGPDIRILKAELPPAAEITGPGLININEADETMLALLPGVGEAIAARIVEYRTENGPFASCEELTAVSGIGEKTLSELLPYITTGG